MKNTFFLELSFDWTKVICVVFAVFFIFELSCVSVPKL
jgi:hypothetical protein